MTSKPDGQWNYILCYRDHGTKICFLRPLATKTVRSVAWALLDIFSVIAPPVRLQTDNMAGSSRISRMLLQKAAEATQELMQTA